LVKLALSCLCIGLTKSLNEFIKNYFPFYTEGQKDMIYIKEAKPIDK